MELLLMVVAVSAFVLALSFTGIYFLNKDVDRTGL